MCPHVHACVSAMRTLVWAAAACDSAKATRTLPCHISAHVLEEKEKSRPSGWFLWFQQTRLVHSRLGWEGKKKAKKTLLFLSECYTNQSHNVFSRRLSSM